MKNTTFVSAGAGSGKTYRLTQDIARMISEKMCKAEEIILTTFTEAAAKELREKVRSTLYSKGLYEAAINIDNAAIGTIHSIAYQFVSRYWYLLGISANVSIMDDEGKNFCVSRSLASLPTEVDMDLFDNVFKSFNLKKSVNNISVPDPDFWKSDLKNIIDKTVELCISESQLEEAKEESKKLINEVVGFCDLFDIGDDKIFELRQLAETILADDALPKTNREKKIEPKMPAIRAYSGISNEAKPIASILGLASEIVAITNKSIKAKYADGIAFAAELADQAPRSVQVKNIIESYIDTIFRLAIQWEKEYEEFKRKRCLLDYQDLLQKFDELLQKEEVVADIQSRYKVALIDEFQDCSPLQVKSFVRLSELMEQSVWVGDIKQAIYGFRGTNTELIKSIIEEVEQENDGNKLDSLKHCWRSNETIVNLVNNIFCEKVFNGQLPKGLIKLDMPERKESDPPAPKERELIHIHLDANKLENSYNITARLIAEQIKGGYSANQIAVLYKDKYGVKGCANALKELGIAYNARWERDANEDENDDIISSFIHAVVSFAARGDNELSKAVIANRVEEGCSISNLLTNRLQNIESEKKGKDWLSDVDIINRISNIRKAIGNQSVSAAIETIVVELNLADLIKRIDPAAPAYNYCSALETKAATYEGICANLGMSSTLVGFVEYLKQHPIEYPGDDNGVSVMTYHKSKGLEWPCVILCSLQNGPVDVKKTYFGVLTYNTATDTSLRLIPSAIKGICSGILDRFEDNGYFKNIKHATINEAKRLMYVGMTRPKEQLILTTYGTKNGDDWLTSIGCDTINSHAAASVINWGGANWKHSVETYVAPEQKDVVLEAAEFTTLKQPTEHQSFESKFISPSKVKTDKQLYSVEQCGSFAERISATSTDGRDSTIGDFVHHLMCLWSGDRSIVGKLAEAYGVNIDVEAVATSIKKFWAWMEQTYGKAISTEQELPFSFTNDLGQIITGEIDLVYHTAEGDVLVDYKTYQGSIAQLTNKDDDFYAGKYGGQLALYEKALSRSGSTIRDRLICYLSLGTIVKIAGYNA